MTVHAPRHKPAVRAVKVSSDGFLAFTEKSAAAAAAPRTPAINNNTNAYTKDCFPPRKLSDFATTPRGPGARKAVELLRATAPESWREKVLAYEHGVKSLARARLNADRPVTSPTPSPRKAYADGSDAMANPARTTIVSKATLHLPKPTGERKPVVVSAPTPTPARFATTPTVGVRLPSTPTTSQTPPGAPARPSNPWDIASMPPYARICGEYRAWRLRKKVPPSSPVFSFVGRNADNLRAALFRRGWVENTDGPASTNFDLKWAVKARDVTRAHFSPGQKVNHFPCSGEVTTKLGLVRNLRDNCIFAQTCDTSPVDSGASSGERSSRTSSQQPSLKIVPIAKPDTFFPRSYDLGEPGEREAFRLDFIRCAALCVLRRVNVDRAFHVQGASRDNFLAACHIIEQWDASEGYLTENDALDVVEQTNHFSPESIMRAATSLASFPGPYVRSDGACAATPPNATQIDAKDETRLRACLSMGEKRERQSSVGCLNNCWIMKPGGKSRGRGVSVIRTLGRLQQIERDSLQATGGEQTTRWVVQKYIEKPLLVHDRKFDLRQWILVTSWSPLTIWWFDECYVRFCAENYDGTDTENKFKHLSNNSIAKHSTNFNTRCIGEGNMWDQETFACHLRLVGGDASSNDGWTDDPWSDVVLPKMQRAAVNALRSAEGSIPNTQHGCFALYGLDYALSASGPDPWLLEVNSSPCLEHSTPVTARLVPRMMESLARVVVDGSDRHAAGDYGGFSLLYRGPAKAVHIPSYSLNAGTLEVVGHGLISTGDGSVDRPPSRPKTTAAGGLMGVLPAVMSVKRRHHSVSPRKRPSTTSGAATIPRVVPVAS